MDEEEMLNSLIDTNNDPSSDDFDSIGPGEEESNEDNESNPGSGSTEVSDDSSDTSLGPWDNPDEVMANQHIEEQLAEFVASISMLPNEEQPKLEAKKKVLLQMEAKLNQKEQELSKAKIKQDEADKLVQEANAQNNMVLVSTRRKEFANASATVSNIESDMDSIKAKIQIAKRDFDIAYLNAKVQNWVDKVSHLSPISSLPEFENLKPERQAFLAEIEQFRNDLADELESNQSFLESIEDSEESELFSAVVNSCKKGQSSVEEIYEIFLKGNDLFEDTINKVLNQTQTEHQAIQQIKDNNNGAKPNPGDAAALAVLFSSMSTVLADLKTVFNNLSLTQMQSQKQIDALMEKTSTLNQTIKDLKVTLDVNAINRLSRDISNTTLKQIENQTESIAKIISEGVTAQSKQATDDLKKSCESLEKLDVQVKESVTKFENSAKPINELTAAGAKGIEAVNKQFGIILKGLEDGLGEKIDAACRTTYASTENVIKKWYRAYGLGTPNAWFQSPLLIFSLINFALLCMVLLKLYKIH